MILPLNHRSQGKSASFLLGAAFLLSVATASPGTTLSADRGKSIVWKVECEKHNVFIAGSVHLLREDDYPIPPTYYRAYQESEKIIFEIDTADMEGLEPAMKMQQLGSYQNGDTLANHLRSETLELLRNFLRERQLPETAFMTMKPGLLSLTLSSLEAMRMGARPDLGLDMRFGALAKEDSITTGGLETIETQLGIFDGFTDEECDELLRTTIESLATITESLDKMISAWHLGDIEGLDTILNSEFEDSEKLRQALLVNRNRNWIPEIERAIAGDRNVMFMVGAGHLIGKDSVIELLEANGHKPVQMTYQTSKLPETAPIILKRIREPNETAEVPAAEQSSGFPAIRQPDPAALSRSARNLAAPR
jgi:uncharacterized protein YbaP (TraB family)